ncbi:hypothetical protein FQA39_LY07509 [Lamprigera yunnana]|nr:hypothetical protein FQA39_LY07509 [Lamprigera yunnana]
MGFEYCAVVNCFNNSGNSKHLKFFRVSKDLKRKQQWLECMGRTDLTKEPEKTLLNRRVCSQHFHVNMLAGMCGSRLRKNAEPTLFEESQGFKAFNITTTSSGVLQNVASDSPTTVHDEVVTTASTLEPSQLEISDKACQTPPELTNSTPRKRALRAEIHNLKRRRISQATQAASQPAQDDFTKENFKKFCINTFSTGMANFFVMQIQ